MVTASKDGSGSGGPWIYFAALRELCLSISWAPCAAAESSKHVFKDTFVIVLTEFGTIWHYVFFFSRSLYLVNRFSRTCFFVKASFSSSLILEQSKSMNFHIFWLIIIYSFIIYLAMLFSCNLQLSWCRFAYFLVVQIFLTYPDPMGSWTPFCKWFTYDNFIQSSITLYRPIWFIISAKRMRHSMHVLQVNPIHYNSKRLTITYVAPPFKTITYRISSKTIFHTLFNNQEPITNNQ